MRLRGRLLGVLLILLGVQAAPAGATVLHKSTSIDGKTVEYEVVLPTGYDASKAYPAVLAFGGGGQTVEGDQRIIEANFREQAEKRGYIVVMPAAPDGVLFFNGSERLIPDFLKQISADYKIDGGKFRVAGRSNGGVSAFEVAALYPQYFVSLTAFPGYMLFPTATHVQAIAKLCIHMFVGQNDELGFERPMNQQAAEFRAQGMAVTYSVEPGQPHAIGSLTGAGSARLFDQFDRDRHGCSKLSD